MLAARGAAQLASLRRCSHRCSLTAVPLARPTPDPLRFSATRAHGGCRPIANRLCFAPPRCRGRASQAGPVQAPRSGGEARDGEPERRARDGTSRRPARARSTGHPGSLSIRGRGAGRPFFSSVFFGRAKKRDPPGRGGTKRPGGQAMIAKLVPACCQPGARHRVSAGSHGTISSKGIAGKPAPTWRRCSPLQGTMRARGAGLRPHQPRRGNPARARPWRRRGVARRPSPRWRWR